MLSRAVMWNSTYDESNDLNWYDPVTGQTFVYNMGDIAWMLVSTVLVMIMIPGVGFFYSGLLRRKNALSMLYFSMTTLAVGSLQWWLWGYSLAYSDTASRFIGDMKHFALQGVMDQPWVPSSRIPAIVFCLYQLMFAAFTPTIALGAFAEHSRLGPVALFVFVWNTLVYDPIACWIWNTRGWAHVMGDLDWAGGTPVHITSGSAALAISLYLGRRHGYGTRRLAYQPHNSSYVVLGTVFLWFGWFGFNGGSALSANLRAIQACLVTHLAACAGGITWMVWDYFIDRQWSVVGFCSGAVSGLVVITPAAGYISIPVAVLFGVLGGTVCNWATQLKYRFHYDDCLDVFASHAIGGILGNLLTGLFAEASAAASDPSQPIKGGWLDRHFIQLAYQTASFTACFFYSLTVTYLILVCFHYIPGLCLRTTIDAEVIGMDRSYMGEHPYDYVYLDLELGYPIPLGAALPVPAPEPAPEPAPAPAPRAHTPPAGEDVPLSNMSNIATRGEPSDAGSRSSTHWSRGRRHHMSPSGRSADG
ncbi:ammonium transporter [Ceratobasidium sp. AG-Ba]|nr:ammonium transporter [Ceratobasidium sp. AG-Ba]